VKQLTQQAVHAVLKRCVILSTKPCGIIVLSVDV